MAKFERTNFGWLYDALPIMPSDPKNTLLHMLSYWFELNRRRLDQFHVKSLLGLESSVNYKADRINKVNWDLSLF